jgi:type IV pilus assembly protein PilM
MLNLRRKNVVGLDIDASAVRMVQLRRDAAGYVVVHATVTDVAPWGDDPQLRGVHTVQAILQGLSSGGIRSKYAVCGLQGSEVVVRDFEFPPLTPEEIAGAVELEVSQICPFLAEESTLDYQVTSNDTKRTMGFWVAATHSLIGATRQIVSQAGLHCALADVAGLALLNLLLLEGPEAKTEDSESSGASPGSSSGLQKAVLNLGDSCATIAIADSAGRPFVRDIGRNVLAPGRQAAFATRGSTHGSFSAEDGWAARNDYRPVTNDSLVEDVATTLRYYAVQSCSTRVDRLLVCGGAGLTEDALELLRSRLNIEVEPWNPLTGGGFRVEDPGGKETSEEEGRVSNPPLPSVLRSLPRYGSSLALATGLAMRAI